MQYRQLGNSGLFVSQLGLGTNAFGKRADEQASIEIIDEAIHSGITFLDTANIYANTESERIIGKALQDKRHEVVLATKAGLPTAGAGGAGASTRGSSRRHLMQELEHSLKRLQTDYIDLYQIHTFDPYTPLEETLRTLEAMVQSGKVRYIGASNYWAWELMKALGISERLGISRYISIQQSYSLADRTLEREIVPLCLDQGVGIIPYFPLAGGILTGKYISKDELPSQSRAVRDPNFQKFLSPDKLQLGQQVSELAAACGCTPAVLSLAWTMKQPAVSTVIVGATSADQLRSNREAVQFEPSEDIMLELDRISAKFIHGEPFASYRLTQG